MFYSFALAVASLPALWFVVKSMRKRGQLTENIFVFLVSGYLWFMIFTLSRVIWATPQSKFVSFILFLIFWYPTTYAFRRAYRKIFQ